MFHVKHYKRSLLMKEFLKDTYFMWDLDGTLIDSYKVIVSSIKEVLNEKNINISYDVIKKEATEHSVGEFLAIISQEFNLSFEELEKECHAHIDKRYLEVEAIKNAKEILAYLSSNGAKHFIYTHKGKSTHDILKNLEMYQYFEEVLTMEDGFKRKPDPEAINYLIEKYIMNKNNTYYIGDRHLDIDSANNAGIKSIFFKPEDSFVEPSGREDYVIHNLIEIKNIFK